MSIDISARLKFRLGLIRIQFNTLTNRLENFRNNVNNDAFKKPESQMGKFMNNGDGRGLKADETQDGFQQAAGDVPAQRVEAKALEVTSINRPEAGAVASNEMLSVLATKLQRILRRIDEIFEYEGFSASPACNIMLELYQAGARGGLLSMSDLCQALTCPTSVARRWIDALTSMQLLEKLSNSDDGPRVALTNQGYLKTYQALKLLI